MVAKDRFLLYSKQKYHFLLIKECTYKKQNFNFFWHLETEGYIEMDFLKKTMRKLKQ